MQNHDIDDILWSFEIKQQEIEIPQSIYQNQEGETLFESQEISQEIEKNSVESKTIFSTAPSQELKKETSKILAAFFFLLRYISTSATIFIVLLIGSNFSAYYSVVSSYVFALEFEKWKEGLISSVEAENITEREKIYQENAHNIENQSLTQHSIKQLLVWSESQAKLDISITPYENRIVIPKIGKNIPLLDIKQQTVSGHDELNNIFMKELENGVIRYPGSAKPGQNGNAFIFWHSSNFPWLPWDYNDVFALLDNLEQGDEVIVYYNQKKYIYKITTKEVIKPGDTSVLKRDQLTPELSIMTCWPIGTTLNRLVVHSELVSQP